VKSDPQWEDFLAIIYPEDQHRVVEAAHAHLQEGTKYDVEYRLNKTD